MSKPIRKTVAGLIALSVAGAFSANANQVMVQELGVSPYKIVTISVSGFYTGGVYAGVNKLLINGTPTDSFCIDPFHFSSSSPLLYDLVPLADAPKPPGPMGSAKALEISELWALAYSPSMTAEAAAGLQIAIWEVLGTLGGNTFSVSNDYGAGVLIATVTGPGYSGPIANLVAVTGAGQDYVIESVPDGGTTATLFGMALVGLAATGLVKSNPRAYQKESQ